MRIFYDMEFAEDGRSIDLISIGMVAEDGREYYAVNADLDWFRLHKNPWLVENVWPHLPQEYMASNVNVLDHDHADVKRHAVIADEVKDFILATPNVELWAHFGAYDHVALCQLWGSMVDLPKGIPMWTNDVQQELMRLEQWASLSPGDIKLPRQPSFEMHHALHDARWAMEASNYLRAVDQG